MDQAQEVEKDVADATATNPDTSAAHLLPPPFPPPSPIPTLSLWNLLVYQPCAVSSAGTRGLERAAVLALETAMPS